MNVREENECALEANLWINVYVCEFVCVLT